MADKQRKQAMELCNGIKQWQQAREVSNSGQAMTASNGRYAMAANVMTDTQTDEPSDWVKNIKPFFKGIMNAYHE